MRYINTTAKISNRTCGKLAAIPDLHAINYVLMYPQGTHKINDSGATMSAKAVFEMKTYSASMTTCSTGNRAVASPNRRSDGIIREYKTKLKNVDKKVHQKLLGMDQMTQLDFLRRHSADSLKGESAIPLLLIGLVRSAGMLNRLLLLPWQNRQEPVALEGHCHVSPYFSPMKHLPMKKKLKADETLTANERLSETSQNLSLAIALSLAVAKTVGVLICSPNSLHSANERV